MRNKNKSLFWYGIKARFMKLFGIIIIFIGFLCFGISYWITGVGFVIGIILLFKGSSSEYNYKRKGGYIIYHD